MDIDELEQFMAIVESAGMDEGLPLEGLHLHRNSWCHCAENFGEKDSILLCLKCGAGYKFRDGMWVKVFSFDNAAMKQVLGVIEGGSKCNSGV